LEYKKEKKFYLESKREFQDKGKITRQIKGIRLLLMNSSGRIYLQKRSKTKSENPGLYDKTVGGHVSAGDSFDMTVIRECAEELGFPAVVVSPKEFKKLIQVTDKNIIGIFQKVDELSNFQSVRIDQYGNSFVQPFMTAIYVGYFDGAIRFVDGESSGIEVFSFSELQSELHNTPEKFTEDIKFIFKKYGSFLTAIVRD